MDKYAAAQINQYINQQRQLREEEQKQLRALRKRDWSRLESEMPLSLEKLEKLVAHVRRRTGHSQWNGCQTSIPLPRAKSPNEVSKDLVGGPEAVSSGPKGKVETITDRRGNLIDTTQELPKIFDGCDATLRYTKEYVTYRTTSVDDWEEFQDWLMEFGGGCDCEVIYNLWDPRWRYRAMGVV